MAESTERREPSAKAGMLRGYAVALKSAGMYDRIAARLSPEVARLLASPPPPSVWVGWRETEEVQRAIEAEAGLRGVREVSREAVLKGLAPMMRAAVDGFLRLFGATPHTLFSRLNEMSRLSTRGIEYEYTRLSDRSGAIVVRYPSMKTMPACTFATAAGGFEALLELTGVRGTVSDPDRSGDPQGNSARFEIAWTPRG